jgi:hypothetical protein
MATYLPHKKGFIGFVSRYVHQACVHPWKMKLRGDLLTLCPYANSVGFGLGWTYLCQFLFVPASHINTASIGKPFPFLFVPLSCQNQWGLNEIIWQFHILYRTYQTQILYNQVMEYITHPDPTNHKDPVSLAAWRLVFSKCLLSFLYWK